MFIFLHAPVSWKYWRLNYLNHLALRSSIFFFLKKKLSILYINCKKQQLICDFCLEAGFHSATQLDLELISPKLMTIFLPSPPECPGYRKKCHAQSMTGTFSHTNMTVFIIFTSSDFLQKSWCLNTSSNAIQLNSRYIVQKLRGTVAVPCISLCP